MRAVRARSASGSGARCRSPSPSRARSAPRACPRCCSRSPASAARPPPSRCSTKRLEAFGKAALNTVGAIDAPARATPPPSQDAPKGIVTLRNVLPDWGARLIVGSLLLPALLAALDAFFRARRRRVPIAPWVAWLAVAAVPLPVAWLWLRALGATGVIDGAGRARAPASVRARDERDRRDGVGAARGRARVLAGAVPGRRAARRATRTRQPEANGRRARPVPGVDGLAVATGMWICATRGGHLGAEPVRGRGARPRHASLAVRRRRLARLARDRRRGDRARADRARRRLLRLRARSRAARPRVGRRARRRRPAPACGRRCCSPACWPRSPASSGCCFARRRLARDETPSGAAIQTRGPLSYAGPGSLGGTESALRR